MSQATGDRRPATEILGATVAMLATAVSLHAQQPREPQVLRLTLAQAVERALEYGEEMRLARASVTQAQGRVTQARADAMPQVDLGVSYQRTFASPFQSSGTGPTLAPFAPDTTAPLDQRVRYLEQEYPNSLQRGISDLFRATPFGQENAWTGYARVSQLLFQGGRVGAGLRGARAYRRGAEETLTETRADIIYRTRGAYLNAVYAERLVAIAEGGRALSEEQLRRVQLNQRAGGAADYDLLRAQVEVANQEPMVIAARNERDLSLLALRQLINVPVGTPLELDPGALASSSDSLVEVDLGAIAASLSDRAAIAAAEANLNVQQAALSYYRSDYWPELRANLYLGQQAYPSGFVPQKWRKDWNASITVSWNIFSGGRTSSQVSQQRAEVERAQLQLEQTRERVSLEVEQARAELVRARALVEARRQTVTQASRAQYLASVRYANGIATPLEVSDARLALQQAQVNEAQASRDYLLSIAAMERALGRPVPVRLVERRAEGQPATGDRRPATGNSMQATGDRRPATGNRE